MGGDVHIYVNHIDQCKLQLSRKPYPLPQLCIKTDRLYIPDTKPVTFANKGIELFDSPEFLPDLFSLINYNYHPPISAEMAV
jgi:thymidylate synthase